MSRFIVFIFILLISISCRHKNANMECQKNAPEINDSICAAFLNEILSDTIDLRILYSQKSFISNDVFYFPSSLPMSEVDPSRSITQYEYVARLFETKDVEFIKGQFKRNQKFNFDLLSSFGFNILDTKGMREKGMTNHLILDYAEKYSNYGYYIISPPIFNKQMNRAYVVINNYGGEIVLFEKVKGKWIKETVLEEWTE